VIPARAPLLTEASSSLPRVDPRARAAAAGLGAIPAGQPVRLAKRTSNLFRARRPASSELDLSSFAGVEVVDRARRRAVVGGLTTYEDLASTTVQHGLVPLCVPQLRTITLGGAVTGLGIEAASFRNGCPHESVTAMEILTGTGDVILATPDNEHRGLFFGFPNSYGSLGYALRLEIELEPAAPYVRLRHLRQLNAATASDTIARIVADRAWQGTAVDYLDGTVFGPGSIVLTLGTYTDRPDQVPSDYTGRHIYYKSLNQRPHDVLSMEDYLWRWDTDWFWCSRAFGAQNPLIRTVWPRRYLRSDAYWKLVALDRRFDVADRISAARGLPPRERVVQDIEVPLSRLEEFLSFFHEQVGISPVWICPLQQRDPDRRWPLYEFEAGTTYVNVGFWSTVPRPDGHPEDGRVNRLIEDEVTRLDGRKSLYSTAYYSREQFDALYGGARYAALKSRYDPQGRFPDMYSKTVGGA